MIAVEMRAKTNLEKANVLRIPTAEVLEHAQATDFARMKVAAMMPKLKPATI
jgi:hypothetical protein